MSKHCLKFNLNLFLRLLVLLCCLVGFGWLCWGQLVKFFSNKATVTVSFVHSHSAHLPMLVFCPRKAFKDKVSPYMPKQQYDDLSTPVNLTFHGLVLNEFEMEQIIPEYTIDYVYTVYNGKCKQFRLTELLPAKHYLEISLTPDQKYVVFLLHPGEDLFLIWQFWIDHAMATADIESDLQLEIGRQMYSFLPTEEKPCDPEISMLEFMTCVHNDVRKAILNPKLNLTCVSIHLAKFVNIKGHEEEHLPLCTTAEQMIPLTYIVTDILFYYVMADHNSTLEAEAINAGKCVKPCTRELYEIKSTKLDVYDDDYTEEEFVLYVSFTSDTIVKADEYYIYDINGIVAAVGGGLGMFLGCSFFSTLTHILVVLCNKIRNTSSTSKMDEIPKHYCKN